MTVIEREGEWINFYWNAESQIKKALWYGFEIAKEPHFESYSKIGLYLCRFDTRNVCSLPNVSLIRDGYKFIKRVGKNEP